MHNVLLIPEVFGFIIDCVAGDVGFPAEHVDEAGQRALAVLARTCRAFSEPALDALWRRLCSLQPFMLCLSTKASYDNEVDEALPAFNEEEWKIVLRYAPRVQELTLQHSEVSENILQSLWFRTTLLLPNLRKLYWVYEDGTAVASIRLLLSPSLVHLHVWIDEGSDHTSILGFLKSYHTLCPNLRSLHFGHAGRYPHVTAAISRAILSHPPNLETLTCDDIDEAALIHAAQSRGLKKFNCSFLNHTPDTVRRLASYGTLDYPPFENLHTLELRIEDISSIIPYFRSQRQPFEEVTIDFHTDPTPEVLHEFFTALSSTTRCRTLRRIDLSSPCLAAETSIQLVDFQVLSPLTTLNLHKFNIKIGTPISLNDDEFVRLVQAWPELEALNLSEFTAWDYPPSLQLPTLKGLLLLLARCPKLHSLGLCLDATSIPLLSEDESLIRNTAITSLSVINSPIREPRRVAHFLLAHLPSLISVPGRPSIPQQLFYYSRPWIKVDQEIKLIRGRRSSEQSNNEMEFI